MASSLFFLDAKRMHFRVMACHDSVSEGFALVAVESNTGFSVVSAWFVELFSFAADAATAVDDGTGSLLSASALATNL